MRHGYYRPMRVSRFRAALGPDGKPLAWTTRVIGIDEDYPVMADLRGLHQLPYQVPNHCSLSSAEDACADRSVTSVEGHKYDSFWKPLSTAGCMRREKSLSVPAHLLEGNPDLRFSKAWVQVAQRCHGKTGLGQATARRDWNGVLRLAIVAG